MRNAVKLAEWQGDNRRVISFGFDLASNEVISAGVVRVCSNKVRNAPNAGRRVTME